MKKIVFLLITSAILFACGGNSSSEEKKGSMAEEKTESATDISDNPDYQNGLALVSKNDCLTCHKIDEKLTGPSYRDVANKYAGMPDTIVTHLAKKIIHGGTGVWGEIAMTPHPGISLEDAETMVKYVLLLKNK
jgi:cytochrome c